MALNGAQLDQDGSPIFITGEKAFLNQSGVALEYESGNGYPGSGQNFYVQKGTLYLTNRRVIYIANIKLDFFKNMNVPLENLKQGQLYQPWFDSNRYEATVEPVPNGGLSAVGHLKLTFKSGGGFEFSSMFMQLRSRLTGETLPHEEALPLYSSDGPSSDAASSSGPSRGGGPSSQTALPIPLPPSFSTPGAPPPLLSEQASISSDAPLIDLDSPAIGATPSTSTAPPVPQEAPPAYQ
ncbi:hypothetical protein DFS34DRAFT_653300 [Phlyctochytrium arcticum]|nr:hypothetical protein DFS34DRAFT_653300 [Phlyctochytrium arcticum]